jgi:hypothetical protein
VYSLYDDTRLLVHAITRVWKLKQYTMLSHDRGTTVGIVALSMLAADAGAPSPAEVVLTNANIYLRLANLNPYQTALLDLETGRSTAAATTPDGLAAGLGASTFMPRRTREDPEIAALVKCFAHDDGVAVLPDTIQYLRERADDEIKWLEALRGVMSTPLWCGVCTTTSRRFEWPTMYGKRSSRTSPGGTVTGLSRPQIIIYRAMLHASWQKSFE